MRDMLDGSEPYPLTAWQGQFRRMRTDLEDAIAREAQYSRQDRDAGQRKYLTDSLQPVLGRARPHLRARAERPGGRGAHPDPPLAAGAAGSAQHRGGAAAGAEQRNRAAGRQPAFAACTAGVERNVYLFVAAMLVLILLTSLYLVQYNRRMFEEVAALSARRSELAQQLIAMQENTFRSISRELHDDFGQILTAIGTMLQRTGRRFRPMPNSVRADLREVQEIVQSTLDKVRTLSHALHPVILDEIGFEGALGSVSARLSEADRHRSALREGRRQPRAGPRGGDSSLPRHAGGAEQHRQAFAIQPGRGAPALPAGGGGARSGRSRRRLRKFARDTGWAWFRCANAPIW